MTHANVALTVLTFLRCQPWTEAANLRMAVIANAYAVHAAYED